MMQWFINEVRDTFRKMDEAFAEHVKKQAEAAEEIKKLKGEIAAMKARAGKTKA